MDRQREYFDTETWLRSWSDEQESYGSRNKGCDGWYTDWTKYHYDYSEYEIYSNAKNVYTGDIVSSIRIGTKTYTTTTTTTGTNFKPFTAEEWYNENRNVLSRYDELPEYTPPKAYSTIKGTTVNTKSSTEYFSVDRIKANILESVPPYIQDRYYIDKEISGIPYLGMISEETDNHLKYLVDYRKVVHDQWTGNLPPWGYAGPPPEGWNFSSNTQGTGYPVLGSASYNQQIQNIVSQKGAREAFNQIMDDVNKYGSKLDDFGSDNVASFNTLVNSVVKQVGAVDKEMHFFRNKLNRCPSSLDAMMQYITDNPDKKWTMLDPDQAAFHMNGTNGEFNLKFVSPDGHFEAVYNSITGALVTDAENMGTYNYVGPSDASGHTTYDVNPYFMWGNIESQGLNRSVAIGGAEELAKAANNLTKYVGNESARIQHDYYFRLLYPDLLP